MIHYKISRKKLEVLIEKECPGWLVRAEQRTKNFARLGYYEESSTIWSEIKKVYIKIQDGKCAYCERQLESEQYGLVEHDMEHFRPKKKARPWSLSVELKHAGIKLTPPVSGTADKGYHLLAYNPLNYCTSCKTCNSNLKKDFFPIEGIRDPDGNDPPQMVNEKPLLINPVSDYDDDPALIIQFHGLSPMACGDTDYRKHRGLVSIKFFKLDDYKRKNLFRERARIITDIYSYYRNAEHEDNGADKEVWHELIGIIKKSSSPHSNCARSFDKLYQTNKTEAKKIFLLAAKYLNSISG